MSYSGGSYWWPRRKAHWSLQEKTLYICQYHMGLRRVRQNWISGRGFRESMTDPHSRSYNGHASQETHRSSLKPFIEVLPRVPQSKNTFKAQSTRHQAFGMDNKYWDVWLSTKGPRWTTAWADLKLDGEDEPHSQCDPRPFGQVVNNIATSVPPPLEAKKINNPDPKSEVKETTSKEPMHSELDIEAEKSESWSEPLELPTEVGAAMVLNRHVSDSEESETMSFSQRHHILEDLQDSVVAAVRQNVSSDDILANEPDTSMLDGSNLVVMQGTTSAVQALVDIAEPVKVGETAVEENDIPSQDVAISSEKDTEHDLQLVSGISREIHILGTDSLGLHIAHSLSSSLHAPPVTLLIHRPRLIQQWHEEGGAVRVYKNGEIHTTSKLNVELLADLPAGNKSSDYSPRCTSSGNKLGDIAEQPNAPIENLIVTTPGHLTVGSLRSIAHRLRPYSTICFMQDGLGIIEEVNSTLFPDPKHRPCYMLGNTTHNVSATQASYTIVEQDVRGKMIFTILPKLHHLPIAASVGSPRIVRTNTDWDSRSRYILRTFTGITELRAAGLNEGQFYKQRLDKLIIDSVIGPLSVMYDCYANDLLFNYSITQAIRLLLEEIVAVVSVLPEFRRIEGIHKHFGARRLERIIVGHCSKIGKNRTSLWYQVNDGRKTDIDYHNGYLLKRANELGIDCPRLEMLVAMVKGKQAMKSKELNSYIEFQRMKN
ncbi:ketopantoate reductase PanE/ApbA C terminal-domain-containing protein [Bisporella sp. PMI_857]|nr:ketopantoate reductase PanE/ApbA C terminal-domain-containing protein [Bisporella sp. PMI_857]